MAKRMVEKNPAIAKNLITSTYSEKVLIGKRGNAQRKLFKIHVCDLI
jgi:hypothetical protein